MFDFCPSFYSVVRVEMRSISMKTSGTRVHIGTFRLSRTSLLVVVGRRYKCF